MSSTPALPNTKCKKIRVGVRSGAAARGSSDCFPRIKVAMVSGGRTPMLWLGGEHKHDGLAWICGRATLRRLRDAIDEVLDEKGQRTT